MNTDEVIRDRFEKWIKTNPPHDLELTRNKADISEYASYPTQFLWTGYQQATKDNAAEIERLREGLKHYANKRHLWGKFPEDWESWDTVSGEPQNWHFPETDEPIGVEDGSIASMVLNGAVMTPDSDETECVPFEALKEANNGN